MNCVLELLAWSDGPPAIFSFDLGLGAVFSSMILAGRVAGFHVEG
jgi:hypothetical protein